MQIPLIGLLLLATPWTGSWKISLEGNVKPMHLVVADADNVALYDAVWMPHEIQRLELNENNIQIRAKILGSAQTFALKAERRENEISGSIALKYPQFVANEDFTGVRVSKKPFPAPVEWMARNRVEGFIDIASYLAEKAPRDSFEEFKRFWTEELEPAFYIFLHANEGDIPNKEDALRQLFDSLAGFTEECIQSERKAYEEGQAASPVGEDSGDSTGAPESVGGTKGDCVVLLPAQIAERQILRLSSIKNKYPPGTRPCCGESLYELEDFLILPVSCVIEPSLVPSESEQDETLKTVKPEESELGP